MTLKTLRAEIQKASEEIRGRFDDSLTVILVAVVDAKVDAIDVPCSGYVCAYHVAGAFRQMYVMGDADQAETLVRAFLDYAYKIEKSGSCRPGAVMMPFKTLPEAAVVLSQPTEGIGMGEHVARLYDAMRAAA